MAIFITDAVTQTWIIITALTAILFFSCRKKKSPDLFSTKTTLELKGLAILAIIFAHIGYFLADDNRFLAPLSNFSGLGVDLFFMLSGYGLVASALKNPLSLYQNFGQTFGSFYKKRLSKIYLPVLFTIVFFLIADYLILHLTFPASTTIKNIFGFFPSADIYQDIDSPLWFITPLLFYYLIFPWIFWKRFPILSAIGVAVLDWIIIQSNWLMSLHGFFSINYSVILLYQLHFLSFPLGMLIGSLMNKSFLISNYLSKFQTKKIYRYLIIAAAVIVLNKIILSTGVKNDWKIEQFANLASALCLLIIFALKNFEFSILRLIGIYSFEIYLFHWPLMYRYNFLFGHIPAAFATLLYITIFIGLGYLLQKFFKKISLKKSKSYLTF